MGLFFEGLVVSGFILGVFPVGKSLGKALGKPCESDSVGHFLDMG